MYDGMALYRAVVASASSTTGEITVRIPAALGSKAVLPISTIGRSAVSPGVWNVPNVGDQVIVAVEDERFSNIFLVPISESGQLEGLTVSGNLSVTGNVTAANLVGSGTSLTNLNATNLTSGTVPVARLTGAYTGITGLGTLGSLSVTGTVTAGTFSGSGVSLTSIPAAQLTGTINTARLSGAYTGITSVGTLTGGSTWSTAGWVPSLRATSAILLEPGGANTQRWLIGNSGDGNLYIGRNTASDGSQAADYRMYFVYNGPVVINPTLNVGGDLNVTGRSSLQGVTIKRQNTGDEGGQIDWESSNGTYPGWMNDVYQSSMRWWNSTSGVVMNLSSAGMLSISNLTSTGRIYSNEWIQFDNSTGLFSPTNAAHFRPNPGTYGAWQVLGTRNTWGGIEFQDIGGGALSLMMNVSGATWGGQTTGVHNNAGGGWLWRFSHRTLICDGANFEGGGAVTGEGGGVIRGSSSSTQTGITIKSSSATAGLDFFLAFYDNANGSTAVGSIFSPANSSTTTYSTTSDYRLKRGDAPLTGSLERIMGLRPISYRWKFPDSPVEEGFFAHEVQEIVPCAAFGEKDAVDAEGNVVAQQIDLARLVPVLVGAVQELTAKVHQLEQQL